MPQSGILISLNFLKALLMKTLFLSHLCMHFSLGQSKVIVTGGFLNGRPTNLVQSVDVNTMECSMLASLNAKRYSHSATEMVWGGEQYIVVAGKYIGRFHKLD